jgi:hypothetical protein
MLSELVEVLFSGSGYWWMGDEDLRSGVCILRALRSTQRSARPRCSRMHKCVDTRHDRAHDCCPMW